MACVFRCGMQCTIDLFWSSSSTSSVFSVQWARGVSFLWKALVCGGGRGEQGDAFIVRATMKVSWFLIFRCWQVCKSNWSDLSVNIRKLFFSQSEGFDTGRVESPPIPTIANKQHQGTAEQLPRKCSEVFCSHYFCHFPCRCHCCCCCRHLHHFCCYCCCYYYYFTFVAVTVMVEWKQNLVNL